MDGRTDEQMDGQMEFLPILQDFVPSRGHCSKNNFLNLTQNDPHFPYLSVGTGVSGSIRGPTRGMDLWMNRYANVQMDVQNFSPSYRSLSPIGSAAQKREETQGITMVFFKGNSHFTGTSLKSVSK